ncbi:MAG: transcription/translation regulatory transformer protein RfaH [Gammaproteobacteria bacterium]
MKSWYLLRTKPRQETLAAENLLRQRFRVFLPFYRRNRRKSGRWAMLEEPLFPGYVFIHIDLAEQNSAPIRSTKGVSGFVRFGLEPATVPDTVVETLMARARDNGEEVPPLFKPGDAVNIVGGGFAGVQAIFQAEKGADRVILLLDLLGRTTRVTLQRDAIVPEA